ncbi:MAG: conjugal transfer protein TraF [Nitrospirota bacterium]|nr:conjugal transfer protein TraF [Nitrospirota bacterium]
MAGVRHIFLLGLSFLLLTTSAFAAEFVTIGPRAMGMGGAHVAVASDATAIYWNPAGLSAQHRVTDIRAHVGAVVKDHSGLADLWDDIDTVLNGREISDSEFYDNPDDVVRLVDILLKLDKNGSRIDINGQAGAIASADIKGMALAIGVTGIGYANAVPRIDLINVKPIPDVLPQSIANNTSAIDLTGLQTIEYSLSLAHGFINDTLHVGATVKLMDAATYFESILAFNTSDTNIVEKVKNNKRTGQKITGDIGVIWIPSEKLRLGAVGKYLTGPSFSSARGSDIKIAPQIRAGAAFLPWRGATVALDIDVTSNETLTPGYKERQVAVGFEQALGTKGKILSDLFTLRAGGYKNVAESGSNFVATAGLGLGLLGLRLDLAGAYDFAKEEIGASANVAFQW